MTMRLDIVTNDAGELVRREHARELGAGVVIAIYRLAKLAQMHDLTNQAFTRQLETTHQIVGDYCLRSGSNVNVMFAHRAIFVAGQLLKGSRSTYEAAAELGEIFERLGGSELHIQRDVTREELLAFAEQISISFRTTAGSFRSPSPKIRLRPVADAARLRGLELENLNADQRIIRTYASAVVIMRRFFEDLQASRYILPRRIKRIAQSLVDLSEGSTPAFLGVTEVRNANFDEAGRAVNTAILAVSMAREVTGDRAILSQIAMAAMMHDVARPRAMALMAAAGPAMPGMQGPSTLSEDQEDRLAAGAAAVLTALGRVNEPSITRTVLTFEALWLRRQTWLGPVYWGVRSPTLHAKLIAIGRRYNDLLTPEPGLAPPTPDYAVAALSEELKDPQDRTVLRMLISALGLLPMGTVVQLSTGEVAEVVRGPKGPGEKPRVRLVMDQNGHQTNPVEIELAQDPHRQVARVMSVDGWRKGLDLKPGIDGLPPDSERDSDPPPAQPRTGTGTAPPAQAAPLAPISPLAPVAMPPPGGTAHAHATSRSIADQYADQYAAWGEGQPDESPRRAESSSSGHSAEHNSSASLPSMGSSPSAVAEAMGRMINDSLRPPTPGREPERTLFQQSSEDAEGRATNRPKPAREPTARGNLASTPLPHVLVYMLDHSLTGTVSFEGGPGEDAIYFVAGVPTKIRLHEPIALLGQILVHGGVLEPKAVDQAVEGARRLGILLGEYLVGHDLVSRESLSWALEAQLLNKIAHLANLAPEITYSYYRDSDMLEGWGGGDVGVGSALNPILASVRNWLDRARIRATLNRIGKHPLVVHEDANLTNLALIQEEEMTLDLIRAESMTLAQLFKRKVADEEVVSSLVYSLAVTRQFAFKGQKKRPMAGKTAGQFRAASPVSGAPSTSADSGDSGGLRVPSPRGASRPAGAPAQSGSRPNASAPSRVESKVPAQSIESAPPQIRSGSGTPLSPPVSVRKPNVAPGAAPPPAGPRPSAPAVKAGALPRANPPQIRPIGAGGAGGAGAKKGTMVGLQPAVPPEQRAKPAAPSPSAPKGPAPSTSAASRPALTPPDGMRTVAVPSPVSVSGARAPAQGGLPRPAPALPSKLARPTGAAPPGAPKPMQPSPKINDPFQTGPGGLTVKAPSPSRSRANGEAAGDIHIELDDGGGPLGANAAASGIQGNAIEIGDDGLADAEAALEAMQSFRLAEAALQRNDAAKALALAQKAVSGDPTQADYVTLLAWIKSLNGSPSTIEEAITTMTRVLGEDPSNERALLYRGKLFARTDRFQEAMADFTELLGGNPQHREAANEVRLLKSKMP
ncbi:MAG: hypothetical protein KF819_19930 [Labilithrix sp.]|nr:hypothetical protein [Labilithrix sp.]